MFIKRLQAASRAFSGLLFVLLFLIFVVQVIARLVFGKPLPWSDEAAVVLYLWVILWANAMVVPQREQVVFDIVWNYCGARGRRILQVIGSLLIGVLSAIALPATWDYVHFMAREGTPVLGIPFMWVFMPLPLLVLALVVRSGCGLMQAFGVLNKSPEGGQAHE